MRILSFDTTNNCVSIALLESGKVVCERLFVATGSERQESVTLLLPAVDEMLSERCWKKTDLDLLVVGVGPGSFTGIRIGVVTARTLAQALNLPLTGVSLLDCYAAKVAEKAGELSEFAIVLSGGRGHFYFAAYKKNVDGGRETHGVAPTETVPPQHGTVVELKAVLSSTQTWAVEPSLVEALSVECADRSLIELPKLENIAAFQGILGWRRVSLSKLPSAIFLASSGVSEENGRDVEVKRWRQSLLIDYPYRIVEPLYLRGASVTLKGSDGKATATT
jgi:tRNA threonylcarbamoyl adenosine modification protein YeaZ